jgi:hypothetical protein
MEARNTVVLRVILCGREASSLILSEGVLFRTGRWSSVGQNFCTIIREIDNKHQHM